MCDDVWKPRYATSIDYAIEQMRVAWNKLKDNGDYNDDDFGFYDYNCDEYYDD